MAVRVKFPERALFPLLVSAIALTHDTIDMTKLCERMQMEEKEIESIFYRADIIWSRFKGDEDG